MPHVKPLYLPTPTQGQPDSGYLILRDGTTASLRIAQREDRDALDAFVSRLSPESRRHRFFESGTPPSDVIASLSDSSDPHATFTLLVIRFADGAPRIIATGSYMAKDATTAEVALAVDDTFHGKGLGTLLLERLALLAVRQGFTRLWAIAHADNLAMREVFRESGFELHESLEHEDIEVELSALPTEVSVARSETRDRIATAASLHPFFEPRAVAVIGASRDPARIGHRLVQALLEGRFHGPVYPVNPKAGKIAGLQAYPSLREVPESIDLAVIAVPREAMLAVVDECGQRGVRALVVITAGFAEVGVEGRRLQDALVKKVRGYGMRLIGPNCMGVLNTDPQVRLNATFSLVFPPVGRVAMSSQSGALGLAILTAAQQLQLGLSTFVSVGNKADVSGNDLLQYWEEDVQTNAILLYLESFGNPRRFARIARRVSRRKPIVVVKAGRTQAGTRAAGSHTAALAASDTAVEALFRQTGVIRAETLQEMFALAAALTSQPLPGGRRVGIVTNAGGPAILCADRCEVDSLTVPELTDRTRASLAALLPSTASLKNPVDLIASAAPDQYRQVMKALLDSDEVDALIVIYVSVGFSDNQAFADAIRTAVDERRAAGSTKPVLVCWMADQDRDRPTALEEAHIPSYLFPEEPAQVLSKAAAYADWLARPQGMIPDFDDLDLCTAQDICRHALATRGAGWLSAEETYGILSAFRLPVVPGGVARTVDDAVESARRVGFPVVVKLVSRSLLHKTEAGGVWLNLADEAAVRRAFGQIHERLEKDHHPGAMEGVLVQPMVSGGVELMVGVAQDPLFGPLIAFGLGGIHVEILGDVCFRVAPLTDRDAAEMIQGIRGHRLLEGYRGHPAADTESIREVLLRVSRLVEEIPEISELDLNPIFALAPGQGCRLVDARIRVESPGQHPP